MTPRLGIGLCQRRAQVAVVNAGVANTVWVWGPGAVGLQLRRHAVPVARAPQVVIIPYQGLDGLIRE